jgi:hypothetical protein
MTKVIDLFTRQPSDAAKYTLSEMGQYAREHAGPEFVKRRGVVVVTDETRPDMDRLFEMFALGIRSDAQPERQLNVWAWLGSRVATALDRYGRAGRDFDLLERQLEPPDFIAYIEAIASGRRDDASAAARVLGVYDGFDDDHPFAKAMEI